MIFTKNKKFKKMRNVVTSLVLAAAIGAAPMSAFAEGYMYDFIQQGVSSNDEIKVLRNTQYITFDDVQPTMVNDRVMVPFRTVLEQMGARVDYYPETNYVAASRGQTSIGFFLDGTTVYRQDPLGESEYVMEVAPTLVNDRTLVSIRFLSEALGLHVGWDDNTVVIFDPLDFVNTAEKVMPNLMSTESLPKFEYAEQDVDLTLDLSLPDEKTGAPSSAKVDTKAQVQKQGENVSITTTSDVVSTLSDGTNLNMRGVVLDVIKTPDAMYVKTDLISKLLEGAGQGDMMGAFAGAFINMLVSSNWIKITPEDLASVKTTPLGDAALSGFSLDEVKDMANRYAVTAYKEPTVDSMMMLSLMLDLFKSIDDKLVVNNAGTGYTVGLQTTVDDIINDVPHIREGENYNDIINMFDGKINVGIVANSDAAQSSVDMSLIVNDPATGIQSKIAFTISDGSKNGEAVSVTVPTNFTTLDDLLSGLMMG